MDLVSRFWCEVLGYHVLDVDEADASVEIGGWDPGERAALRAGLRPPTIVFVTVPEDKSVKDRIHIDVNPVGGTQESEVERLLALGATRVDVGQGDASWVVLGDPEGNEFCVLGSSTTA